MRLYGRQMLVEVGLPGQVGKRFTDLAMKAQIDMRSGPEPNDARITLYNPSEGTRDLLRQDGVVVRVLAGYGTALQVFQGDPVANGVEIRREGVDRVVTIEAQDGGRAFKLGRISRSFAAPVPWRQVFEEVAGAMGLGLGRIDLEPTERSPAGLTLFGYGRDVLDRMASIAGGTWTIRDGLVYLVKAGGTTGESAVVFSAAAGNLVGAPRLGDEGKVEVKALLSPSMRPEKPFRVESEAITGDFRAEEVRFDLTSRETPFYVVVKGVPV